MVLTGRTDYVRLHRGELPDNTTYVDPKAKDVQTRDFMRRVHTFGSDLEIVFNPLRGKWALYRVVLHGGARSSDLLQWEFDLDHPPGEWLIAKMERDVLTRCDRGYDHEVAGQRWLKSLCDKEQALEWERTQRWNDFRDDTANDMDIYAFRGRTSGARTQMKQRNRRPAIRANNYWMLSPGVPQNGTARRIQTAYR